MSPEKKPLKERGPQRDPFKRFNADVFDPSKHRRPCADPRSRTGVIRKPHPVLAWKPVMLDMITIIEERQIVKEAVMTRSSSGMLEITMQETQTKTQNI